MLGQVKDHLDAVREIRSRRPSARDEGKRDDARGEMRLNERTRELRAAVENQQGRLSQSLEHSSDLLSVSEDQADRFVAALEHAAARIAPVWVKTTASARAAEALQRQVERAKELRNGIVAAAAALAAIAEEVALVNQDLKTPQPRSAAERRHLVGEASISAGKADRAHPARTTAAEQARRAQDLPDQVINRLFQAGRRLQSAADLPMRPCTRSPTRCSV